MEGSKKVPEGAKIEARAEMTSTAPEGQYGALVGWKADDLHDRIILRMESVKKPPPHSPEDVIQSVFVLDKNQVVQLGYYLFKVSGQSLPTHKRSWLRKLFGA